MLLNNQQIIIIPVVKVFLGDQKIKTEIFDVNSLNEKQTAADLN